MSLVITVKISVNLLTVRNIYAVSLRIEIESPITYWVYYSNNCL